MNKEEIEKLLYREDLSLASIQKRSVAFVLDELLLSLIVVVALWSQMSSATTMAEMIALTNQFAFEYIILKIIYQAFFVYQYGATLGKMAMRIRVIELPELDNPSFIRSLNRAVIRIFSEMFFYLGFIWGMMDSLKRTWHDLSAQTVVVERE